MRLSGTLQYIKPGMYCIQDGKLFEGYKAHQLMNDGRVMSLGDTKWKCAYIQCEFKPSVTPGSSFVYYNPKSGK